MTLTIKIFPRTILPEFTLAVMEGKYAERLSSLYEGKLDVMEREQKEFNNLKAHFNEPKICRWKTFNTIAMMEATRDLLPSERNKYWAEVWF
jgi:hypothetical protein